MADSTLNLLHFDHRFTGQLAADPETANFPRQVFGACYSWVSPKPTSKPQLLIFSPETASLLDLQTHDCNSALFTRVFSGNALLENMKPYAMCYGGHQFGSWAGQLGDGRAINLGDVINSKGERWCLQLKGAGATPYSRSADGLAVLRSSVREFLCSEAMFHLGVPTTRALSLCTTGDRVSRDMFYDGNPALEQGAVVCRVAPSFLRFGNFEIFAARQDFDSLKALLDFTIQTHFPHLLTDEITSHTYLQWFREVCHSTREMIVHWQRVGFVHGVMNTDNMSILGLTIDYGPYGWLEDYNPDWTPNTTDSQFHRYAFGNQGHISHWNLLKLAQAIAPLFEETTPLQQVLDEYQAQYLHSWQQMMAAKLGLTCYSLDDESLITDLFETMLLAETDMTIFFRLLANIKQQDSAEQCLAKVADAFYQADALTTHRQAWLHWFKAYLHRLQGNTYTQQQRQSVMNRTNPKYVLRNYLAQLAIDRTELGDFTMLHELLETLRSPYTEQPDHQSLAQKRPDWAKSRAGCSMLSCSS